MENNFHTMSAARDRAIARMGEGDTIALVRGQDPDTGGSEYFLALSIAIAKPGHEDGAWEIVEVFTL